MTASSVKGWKEKGKGLGVIHEVVVPSGNTARMRRPGLDTFLRLGLIPNSLMSIISGHISKAKDGKPADLDDVGAEMAKLMEDPVKLGDILQFADNVLIHCAVEPEVHPVTSGQEARNNDWLYVDEVDFDDKMFIFQWAVGGTEDLETFRAEQAAGVGAVVPSAAASDASEQSGGAD